jgi:hypothetical protein
MKCADDECVRRLVLEVQHNRRTFDEMRDLYHLVVKTWQAEKLGTLVCMEQMRKMLEATALRRKGLSSTMPPPPPPRDPPDEAEVALVD